MSNGYPEVVTDEIREQIRELIKQTGLSQAEIARRMGIMPQNLNRALQERGLVAPVWQRILNYFDLELIIVPKNRPEKEKEIGQDI